MGARMCGHLKSTRWRPTGAQQLPSHRLLLVLLWGESQLSSCCLSCVLFPCLQERDPWYEALWEALDSFGLCGGSGPGGADRPLPHRGSEAQKPGTSTVPGVPEWLW